MNQNPQDVRGPIVISGEDITPQEYQNRQRVKKETTPKPLFALGDLNPITAVGRAVEGMAQDVIALDDLFRAGPPRPRSKVLGEPESVTGDLIVGALEFASFFIPSRIVVGAGVKAVGLSARAAKAGGFLSRALPYAEVLAAGASADFMTSSQGAALSGFLSSLPSQTAQAIGGILASEENETQLERRLKGALEGLIVGPVLDATVHGLSGAWSAMRGNRSALEAAAVRTEASIKAARAKQEASTIDPEGALRPLEPVGPRPQSEAKPAQAGTLPELRVPGDAAIPDRPKAPETPYDRTRVLFGVDTAEIIHNSATSRSVDPSLKGSSGNVNPNELSALEKAVAALKKGDPNRRQWRTSRDAAEIQTELARYADFLTKNDKVVPQAEQVNTELRWLADLTGEKNPNLLNDVSAGTPMADQLRKIHAYTRLLRATAEGHIGRVVQLSKQAIDNPGDMLAMADALDALSFQTMLTNDARALTSEMGRGLGSLNFDNIKVKASEVEALRQRWQRNEPLTPFELMSLRAATNDKAVPFGALVNDAGAFNDAIKTLGGMEKTSEMLKKVSSLNNTGLPSGRLAAAINGITKAEAPTLVDFSLEWFINSILSAPSTLNNVAVQQLTQGIYWQPLRRMLAARGAQAVATIFRNKAAAAEMAKVARAASSTLSHTVNANTMEGMSAAIKLAFKEGEGTLLGRAPVGTQGGGAFHDAKIAYEPIRAYFEQKMPFVDADGVFARSIYWLFTEKGVNVGHYVRLPGRALTVADEITKQVVARSVLAGELEAEAAERFVGDAAAAAKWVADTKKKILDDGVLQTKEVLQAKALQKAEAEGALRGWTRSQVSARAKELFDQHMEDDYVRSLTDYIASQANEAAATLRPDRKTIASKVIEATNDKPALRFFLPFVRSSASNIGIALRPLNVVGWAEWVTHMRMPKTAENLDKLRTNFAKEILSDNPSMRADAYGRLATATSIAAMVYAWAGMETPDGLPAITGSGPKGTDAKKILSAAGWRPWSVRLGDSYVGYANADPTGVTIGLLADLAERGTYAADDDADKMQSAIGGVILSMTEMMKEKSYLLGLSNMIDMMKGEKDWTKVGYELVGSMLVPNLMTRGGQNAADLVMGQHPQLREARTLIEELEQRLPFADQRLPHVYNVYGEPVDKHKYIGLDFLSPFAYNNVTEDKVKREFAMLGARFGPPSKLDGGVDLLALKDDSGMSVYDRLQKEIGETRIRGLSMHDQLKRLIDLPAYQNIPTREMKLDFLRSIIEDYRQLAKLKLMQSIPQYKLAKIEAMRQELK